MPVRTLFAPAKVNLHLHVVGRRDDGYHLLDSLVTFAEVGDRLTVTPSDELSLSIVGPFAASLANEPENLVLRAAQELADRIGLTPTGHIELEKNLPVASGIGGGSADAAAAMKLMMYHWQIMPDPDDIKAVALRLGADVPVCLAARTIRMSGVGDVLDLTYPLPPIGMVLINPGVPVSTAAIFKSLSGPFSGPAMEPHAPWKTPQEMVEALEPTRNDLQGPACRLVPVINDVLDAIKAMPGCLMARMSGSGATCFGIFENPEAARSAAAGFSHPGWWIWGGPIRPHHPN
ncbi:MAG TPA: 4-(cytidine 5'-diphospho)-2-C-methyl-D-erythritol kinase [Rhodopila sp.]|nr:4-(cytidine 5'-diphospho)-2-C-methyl-D-erythritol kinase [Rhodopila sp.]